MRVPGYLACAFLAFAAFGGGAASAANICRAGNMTCATTMPVDGYCECKAHGTTEEGTVVAQSAAARHKVNATGAGCGANPSAPGCSN
jgi:hypothetical protein